MLDFLIGEFLIVRLLDNLYFSCASIEGLISAIVILFLKLIVGAFID